MAFSLQDLCLQKYIHRATRSVFLAGLGVYRRGSLKKRAGGTTRKKKKPSYGFLRSTEEDLSTVIVYRLLVRHLKMPELRRNTV